MTATCEAYAAWTETGAGRLAPCGAASVTEDAVTVAASRGALNSASMMVSLTGTTGTSATVRGCWPVPTVLVTGSPARTSYADTPTRRGASGLPATSSMSHFAALMSEPAARSPRSGPANVRTVDVRLSVRAVNESDAYSRSTEPAAYSLPAASDIDEAGQTVYVEPATSGAARTTVTAVAVPEPAPAASMSIAES